MCVFLIVENVLLMKNENPRAYKFHLSRDRVVD
jgi:hypothetical protein